MQQYDGGCANDGRKKKHLLLYGHNSGVFQPNFRGRLAKIRSFLLKHSSTEAGDDTRRTLRQPNERNKTGPYVLDRFCNVLCTGSFMRCRWPIMGSEVGLGGRFLYLIVFSEKSFETRKIKEMVKMM